LSRRTTKPPSPKSFLKKVRQLKKRSVRKGRGTIGGERFGRRKANQQAGKKN